MKEQNEKRKNIFLKKNTNEQDRENQPEVVNESDTDREGDTAWWHSRERVCRV